MLVLAVGNIHLLAGTRQLHVWCTEENNICTHTHTRIHLGMKPLKTRSNAVPHFHLGCICESTRNTHWILQKSPWCQSEAPKFPGWKSGMQQSSGTSCAYISSHLISPFLTTCVRWFLHEVLQYLSWETQPNTIGSAISDPGMGHWSSGP